MILCKWDELPEDMRNPEVREYYDILSQHKFELLLKRVFDFTVAFVLFLILAIPMLVIGFLIAIDSPGGVFYRQERITAYGKKFRIHKFRTMVSNADKMGAQITVRNDCRVTKMGARLRRNRLDELPQVFDVLKGSMSFVGTRPEVAKYVEQYTDEMKATLLMPAGITSEASIRFKGEAKLLVDVDDIDAIYINEILPRKMHHNLKSIREFGFWKDIRTMIRTVLAVMGKDYKDETADMKALKL